MTDFYRYLDQLPDPDAAESQEWADSVDGLTDARGKARARRVLLRALGRAEQLGVGIPPVTVTDYFNTIPAGDEPPYPGDEDLERRIRHLVRWNAAVMVARANRRFDGSGGHLATYASAAMLFEVGFNHFFRGKADGGFGDQVFFQGHASPGIYARAFLEGRLGEADLARFRREVGGGGLPSYPHPRSDFWEYPTVPMGLGPITAAYQARFNRYLHDRGIADTSDSKVWCFVGDGDAAGSGRSGLRRRLVAGLGGQGHRAAGGAGRAGPELRAHPPRRPRRDGCAAPRVPDHLTVQADDKEFPVRPRIDTVKDAAYYRHGGILPYVLRRLAGQTS